MMLENSEAQGRKRTDDRCWCITNATDRTWALRGQGQESGTGQSVRCKVKLLAINANIITTAIDTTDLFEAELIKYFLLQVNKHKPHSD